MIDDLNVQNFRGYASPRLDRRLLSKILYEELEYSKPLMSRLSTAYSSYQFTSPSLLLALSLVT